MKSAWKKVKTKIVYKNPWYQVREDKVIRPDGKKGQYCVIEGKDSVAVLAIDKKNNIYLVGQTRYPINNFFSLEIVAGGIKPNTSPLKTAKEELEEEAGLMAAKWTNLGYYYPVNGISSLKISMFLAEELQEVAQKLEVTEDIKVEKIKIDDAIKMIKNNKITDGLTITTIYKYLLKKYPRN